MILSRGRDAGTWLSDKDVPRVHGNGTKSGDAGLVVGSKLRAR